MKLNQLGFTLTELIIAMAIFSTMLVIVTTGFITSVRLYVAGTSARTTQDNARSIMDVITRDIRASNGVLVTADVNSNTILCTYGTSSRVVYHEDSSQRLLRGTSLNQTNTNTTC